LPIFVHLKIHQHKVHKAFCSNTSTYWFPTGNREKALYNITSKA